MLFYVIFFYEDITIPKSPTILENNCDPLIIGVIFAYVKKSCHTVKGSSLKVQINLVSLTTKAEFILN